MCSSARMMGMTLAAAVCCLAVMSSVMAESNDEYYYNSLYRDGEGYNDKNVRNLDGIDNQLDTWLMLGYPQMMVKKRQLDSIGGGSLLKRRSGEQKMTQNLRENPLFDQDLMEQVRQQQMGPKIGVDTSGKWALFNKVPKSFTQKRQMDSIGGGSLLKRSFMVENSRSQPEFEEYFLEKLKNFNKQPKISTQKRQIDSIGGGSLLKRSSLNARSASKPEFEEYSLNKWINVNNKPEISTEKRQMDSIGGGSILKRSSLYARSALKPEFEEDSFKEWTSSNIEPKFLTQKRQMDSIGGGNLLKRSSKDDKTQTLSQQIAETLKNGGRYQGSVDLEDLEKSTNLQEPKMLTNDRLSDPKYVESLFGEYLVNQKPKIQIVGGSLATEIEGSPLEDHGVEGMSSLRGDNFGVHQGLGDYLESQKPKIQIIEGSLGTREVGFPLEVQNGQQNPLLGNTFFGRHTIGGYLQKPEAQNSGGVSVLNIDTAKQLMDSFIEGVQSSKLQVKDLLNHNVVREIGNHFVSQRPRIQIKESPTGSGNAEKPSRP